MTLRVDNSLLTEGDLTAITKRLMEEVGVRFSVYVINAGPQKEYSMLSHYLEDCNIYSGRIEVFRESWWEDYTTVVRVALGIMCLKAQSIGAIGTPNVIEKTTEGSLIRAEALVDKLYPELRERAKKNLGL